MPAEYRVKFATDAWERREALRCGAGCSATSRAICDDDRDAIDDIAIPIVAISSYAMVPQEVVGTVRIHEAEPGVWWGSRLAVAADYRRIGALGTSLIRLAVSSAHARGCRRFLAHVQARTCRCSGRLRWETIEETVIHGRAHHFMQADLGYYPPIADAEAGFLSLPKKAGLMLGAAAFAELPPICGASRSLRPKATSPRWPVGWGSRPNPPSRWVTTARRFPTAAAFCCSPSKVS